jgi:hypothetical protein
VKPYSNEFVFTQEDLQLSAKLPKKIQKFKDKYPYVFSQVLEFYWLPPLPADSDIEKVDVIWRDEKYSAWLTIFRGQLWDIELELPPQVKTVEVFFDIKKEGDIYTECVYLQIEDVEVINRLKNIALPPLFSDLPYQAKILSLLYERNNK